MRTRLPTAFRLKPEGTLTLAGELESVLHVEDEAWRPQHGFRFSRSAVLLSKSAA